MTTSDHTSTASATKPSRYRSVWISDVHLGTKGCRAEALCQFLKEYDCDTLYLVGDIVDGWRLKKNLFWPQEHSNVIRRILTKAKRGTKIVYVVGNHDEFLRKLIDGQLQLGNITLTNEWIHETADGRRMLVTHGDLFDIVTRYHTWIAKLGSAAYEKMVDLNKIYNDVRGYFGGPYWSLAAFLKHRVKSAGVYIREFETALSRECQRRDLDGVICGHIHNAVIRDIDGVTYHNCGDWVESGTALVENQNGLIEVIHYAEQLNQQQNETVKLQAAA